MLPHIMHKQVASGFCRTKHHEMWQRMYPAADAKTMSCLSPLQKMRPLASGVFQVWAAEHQQRRGRCPALQRGLTRQQSAPAREAQSRQDPLPGNSVAA